MAVLARGCGGWPLRPGSPSRPGWPPWRTAASTRPRKRRRARCSRPRAVTSRHPSTVASSAGRRPSHSTSSSALGRGRPDGRAPRAPWRPPRSSRPCSPRRWSPWRWGTWSSTRSLCAKRSARASCPPPGPALIGNHATGGRVEPHPGDIAVGDGLDPAPRDEEDLSHRVLGVGPRCRPPTAVRHDVEPVALEQHVEAPPTRGVPGHEMSFVRPIDHTSVRQRSNRSTHHPSSRPGDAAPAVAGAGDPPRLGRAAHVGRPRLDHESVAARGCCR